MSFTGRSGLILDSDAGAQKASPMMLMSRQAID